MKTTSTAKTYNRQARSLPCWLFFTGLAVFFVKGV